MFVKKGDKMIKIPRITVEDMAHFDNKSQVAIETDKGKYFISYSKTIAFIDGKTGKVYLDEIYWEYTLTTGKYRNRFLRESKQDTKKKIKNGTYILIDLN